MGKELNTQWGTPRVVGDSEVGDLANRFGYHPPLEIGKPHVHEQVRRLCFDLAVQLSALVPPGREQSLMLTKLEEAAMWANAGVARVGWDAEEDAFYRRVPDSDL